MCSVFNIDKMYYFSTLDGINVPFENIEYLNLSGCYHSLLCRYSSKRENFNKMKNLKYLKFDKYLSKGGDEMFSKKYIEMFVSIVEIKKRMLHGRYVSCLRQIGNMKYTDIMVCTDFSKNIDTSDIKRLNLILLKNCNEYANEFKLVTQKLPCELEFLQISIDRTLFEKYNYFTNLPIGLKTFNLYLFETDDVEDKDIDFSHIKVPFGCEFNCKCVKY
jgi:hypothetical protein